MLWIDLFSAQVEKGVVKAVMKPKLRMQLTRQRVAKSGEDEIPGCGAFRFLFRIFKARGLVQK